MQSAWSFWQVLDATVPCNQSGWKCRLPHKSLCTHSWSECWDRDLWNCESHWEKDFLYIWKRQARAHDSHCQCETLFKSQTCPEPSPPRGPFSIKQPDQGVHRALHFHKRLPGWLRSKARSPGRGERPVLAHWQSVSVPQQATKRPSLPGFWADGKGLRRRAFESQPGFQRDGHRPGATWPPRPGSGQRVGGCRGGREGNRQASAGLPGKWPCGCEEVKKNKRRWHLPVSSFDWKLIPPGDNPILQGWRKTDAAFRLLVNIWSAHEYVLFTAVSFSEITMVLFWPELY